MTTIRALAFGDDRAWGAAWIPGGAATISLAGSVGSSAGIVRGKLDAAAESEPWQIEGDGASLRLAPIGPADHAGAADAPASSLDQLCMVSGTLRFNGTGLEISSLGWRSTLKAHLELDQIESFRQTAGWLEPTQGFSLAALRPRKARGQDADLVTAVLLEAEATPAVVDPRLSTTYNAAGFPARAGLELWLEEEDEDENNRHYPRRAAGEAVGAGVDWELAGFALHAALLRWHSRGIDGTGIYLLGRHE